MTAMVHVLMKDDYGEVAAMWKEEVLKREEPLTTKLERVGPCSGSMSKPLFKHTILSSFMTQLDAKTHSQNMKGHLILKIHRKVLRQT